MTPTWDPDARGVLFGLALSHRREHLARAVLEGCAYGLKDLVDRIECMGLPVAEIRSVAGGARSEVWCQIKADVTGRVVVVPEVTETTALGAAMIAGAAVGAWKLDEAVSDHVRIAGIYEPDPAVTERYQEGYDLYRHLYDAVTPLFHRAANP
jgi:xylulokinase